MKQYKHTQIGYLLIIVFSVTLILIGILVFRTNFNPGLIFVFAFIVLCLMVFSRLTVEVDDQVIDLKFGMGVIRKRFPLKDVKAHRVVRNPWYYSWGIHVIPNGWIFNVSGLEAVELQMKNNRRYRVGTDDVEGLMNAVKAGLQKV
jgi:hypothetical protein